MKRNVLTRLGGLSIGGLTLAIGLLGGSGRAIAETNATAEFGFYLRADLAKMVQQGSSDRVLQEDPRIVRLMRTACGPGATASVSTMPKFTSRESLVPEKVVEVDARNRTIRRWGKPLNSRVMAISGDRILVQTDSQSYWIGTDGRLELQTETRSLLSPTDVPYKKHPEFGTSGIYSQRFVDANSGRDRQIIADAPCT
jgi:hypothetical protein